MENWLRWRGGSTGGWFFNYKEARFKPVEVSLNSDQEAEAERIYQQIREKFDEEACRLASKRDSQLFGQTEFEVRDRAHVRAISTKAQGWHELSGLPLPN